MTEIVSILSKEEFKKLMIEVMNEALLSEKAKPPEQDEYLTRQEAKNLLKVSLPTLDSYRKKGFIRFKKIGGRVLFNKSELLNDIKKLNQ